MSWLNLLLAGIRKYEKLILQVGLGLVLLYAGFNSLGQPNNWLGFVPEWVGYFMDLELFLSIHAGAEIIMGLALIIGFWVPLFSALTVLNMLSILFFFGVDDITFRDIGLFAAALVLFSRSVPE